MSISGTCPVRGCEEPLFKGIHLMCRRHWAMLPDDESRMSLKKTIRRLYADGKKWEGYEEACANAIAQVEEIERNGVLDPEKSWPFRRKPGEQR